jgi:hypothetical protein
MLRAMPEVDNPLGAEEAEEKFVRATGGIPIGLISYSGALTRGNSC